MDDCDLNPALIYTNVKNRTVMGHALSRQALITLHARPSYPFRRNLVEASPVVGKANSWCGQSLAELLGAISPNGSLPAHGIVNADRVDLRWTSRGPKARCTGALVETVAHRPAWGKTHDPRSEKLAGRTRQAG